MYKKSAIETSKLNEELQIERQTYIRHKDGWTAVDGKLFLMTSWGVNTFAF